MPMLYVLAVVTVGTPVMGSSLPAPYVAFQSVMSLTACEHLAKVVHAVDPGHIQTFCVAEE